jgi:hypothetical protein
MYRFYNTTSTDCQESFNNLQAAISGHDYPFIIGLLRDNQDLIMQKTDDGKTVPMLLAKSGCSPATFRIILEQSSNILQVETKDGESVQSILEKNKRYDLLKIFNDFMKCDGEKENRQFSLK